MIISCGKKETIVEVPVEVPANCPPSAPCGVQVINWNEEVWVCWFPNVEPEDDLVGYDVFKALTKNEKPEYLGSILAEDPDPEEYCFRHSVDNGVRYYYCVRAYDEHDILSDYSEKIIGTARYEGFVELRDTLSLADSSGYDFSTLSNEAQLYTKPFTDIYYTTGEGVNRFHVNQPGVKIQDLGFTSYDLDEGLDYFNQAPLDGWSPSGVTEVIEGHCYILRFGEPDGFHYGKLWIDRVSSTRVSFYWAYQTDADNPYLMPGPPSEEADGGEKQITELSRLERDKEGKRIKTRVRRGRQIPPATGEGH